MMKTLELTKEEFENLKPLHLIQGTLEKESDMYYAPGTKKKVIKVYKNYEDQVYIDAKMLALDNLLQYTKELDFPELLKPIGILKVEDKIMGTIYPKITGYTSRIYLNTFYDTMDIKIAILRKIGELLERIANTNPKYNAAFADVHVDNFIVNGIPLDNVTNIDNIKITACDTDSMKILSSPGITGYYLYDSDKLSDFSKYPLDMDGFVLANTNTDIYCYSMMLLDLISKSEYVYTLNIDEYYRYLDYLDKLGFDGNLLNAFASVYEEDIDNISPLPYLEGLKKISNDSSLTNFYKQRIKKIGK